MKKGQISVFVILAIVIIAAGGFAYYTVSHGGGKDVDEYFFQPDVKPQFDSLVNSLEECMKGVAFDSIEVIGIQGGYYKQPIEFFDLDWAFIPYYYKEGGFLMPTKQKIESELALSMDDNLAACFDDVDKKGFEVSYSKSATKVSVEKGEVVFSVDMPLSIKKGGRTAKFDLKKLPVTQSSKLYDMYEVAKYITDSHREDPKMICISCVGDMARERGLYVDIMDFNDESSSLIVISQNSSESSPFVFEFLNKYHGNKVL